MKPGGIRITRYSYGSAGLFVLLLAELEDLHFRTGEHILVERKRGLSVLHRVSDVVPDPAHLLLVEVRVEHPVLNRPYFDS